MTYDNEAIVRHAYHTAEGSVQDIAGFVGSFAEDGVISLSPLSVTPLAIWEVDCPNSLLPLPRRAR